MMMKRARTKGAAALLAMTLAAPSPAWAEEQSAGQEKVASEGQTSPPGPETQITVTATRTPTPVNQLGQSVTIVTAEEMEAQGARSLLQVLETVPGLNVVRTGPFGGAATVFVRGGESDFNLVLIDGVPINQAGGGFDFGDITTANVERLEIVRGPASVLYGADAASSVINILTRQGEGRPSGRFSFEGGSHDSYLFRGNLAGGSRRVHYSLGAHWSKTDGFYDFNNHYDRAELSADTVFDLTGSSSLSAHLRYLDSEYAFPTDFTGALVDPNDYRSTEETHYSVAYQSQLSRIYGTRLQYGYHRRLFQNFTLRDGVDDFFDSTFRADEERSFLDWQNNLRVGDHHLLTAGLSYEREKADGPALLRRGLGVYVQEQFELRDRLFLTGGVRYEDNDRFESFVSGKLSVGFRLTPEWRLRGSFGNGFRAPSFVEILGFPEFGIVGNPNLQPEKNVATDLGADYRSSDGLWGFSTTLFVNRFSDLIEFSFLVPPGSSNYLNLEKAESQGLELEGFWNWGAPLRLGGHYTFLDTEVTDAGSVPGGNFEVGRPLLRRPRHQAALFAQYSKRRYQLRIDFKFKGRREDIQFFPDFSSNRVTLDSYWKTDFGVTLPLMGFSDSRGDLALVLRGENLLGRRYTEVAGFESPGRTLFAGLEVAF